MILADLQDYRRVVVRYRMYLGAFKTSVDQPNISNHTRDYKAIGFTLLAMPLVRQIYSKPL